MYTRFVRPVGRYQPVRLTLLPTRAPEVLCHSVRLTQRPLRRQRQRQLPPSEECFKTVPGLGIGVFKRYMLRQVDT
jgi:hypothetical protein